MSWRVAIVVAALVAVGAPAAVAQPSPFGAGAAEPAPRTREEEARAARDEAWRAAEETEKRETASGMKRPEKLTGRPSGFWTSTRPAKGGAYRWRIMAAGIVVLGITIFFVLRLLRRTAAERAAQPS